jgi:O-antigen/teichoic acid export membrane protein
MPGPQQYDPHHCGPVIEVLLKVIVGLVLSWYLTHLGKSLPVASATGAVFGVVVGDALGALIIWSYIRHDTTGRSPSGIPRTYQNRRRYLLRLMRNRYYPSRLGHL